MKLPTIEGRECVPVRLLPFLTDWDPLTTDVVAQLFAGRHPWHKWSLPLFRFQRDGTYGAVSARSWEDIAIDLEELEASLSGQQHPIWRRRSVELLPTADFVWKADLEAEYARTYLNPKRFLAGSDATPRELDFTRPLSPEEEELVFDGFGAATDTTTAQASTSARPSHPRAETQSPGTAQLADALAPCLGAVVPSSPEGLPEVKPEIANVHIATPPPLTTGEVANTFDGINGLSERQWRSKLGDLNNFQWLLAALVLRGRAPNPSTWDPVKLAELLVKRDASSESLNRLFLQDAKLKPWLAKWQETTAERNAFGR